MTDELRVGNETLSKERMREAIRGTGLTDKSTSGSEPVAWAATDWMRSITETELALIPNVGADKGRRDSVRLLYRIPLYAHPAAGVATEEEVQQFMDAARVVSTDNRYEHGRFVGAYFTRGALERLFYMLRRAESSGAREGVGA